MPLLELLAKAQQTETPDCVAPTQARQYNPR